MALYSFVLVCLYPSQNILNSQTNKCIYIHFTRGSFCFTSYWIDSSTLVAYLKMGIFIRLQNFFNLRAEWLFFSSHWSSQGHMVWTWNDFKCHGLKITMSCSPEDEPCSSHQLCLDCCVQDPNSNYIGLSTQIIPGPTQWPTPENYCIFITYCTKQTCWNLTRVFSLCLKRSLRTHFTTYKKAVVTYITSEDQKHASTCFEYICSKHVEEWNKLIVKKTFCASSWLITEINILRCTVSKMSKTP